MAQPGHSEHQLGTAVDLTGASIGYLGAYTGFESTKEGIWLAAHAYQYGFTMSYPHETTEYIFEPWHYRYVGVSLATTLHTLDMSFDEYYATTTPMIWKVQ